MSDQTSENENIPTVDAPSSRRGRPRKIDAANEAIEQALAGLQAAKEFAEVAGGIGPARLLLEALARMQE